jgi:hypothetical protein
MVDRSSTRRRRVLGALAALAALSPVFVSAAPAEAATGCSLGAASTPFTAFGDDSSYSLVPGGLFTGGAPGWSLTQSSVVSGGFELAGGGGANSLGISASGEALSPAICVTSATPTLRFAVRRTSGTWGALNVVLQWTNTTGVVYDTTVASVDPTTTWQPTPIIQLSTVLPIWNSSQEYSVKLLFKPEQCGGNVAIDDVYFDPRMVD